MIRKEYVCDLCRKPVPQGKPVMAFEFKKLHGGRDDDIFDWDFNDPGRMERHWCGPCLRGVAAMVPGAVSRLKTIS